MGGFRLRPLEWLRLAREVRDNPSDVTLGARVFFAVGGHDEGPTYRRFLRAPRGAQLGITPMAPYKALDLDDAFAKAAG